MSPSVRFVGQPVAKDLALGEVLKVLLADPQISSLTTVVAWARFRGLARLKAELEAFHDRGGSSRLILGIDEGGATRPGLLLAAELVSDAYVFHDPGGNTFHPKIYLAEGSDIAVLIVGSSNATPGGWFNNYEASLEARFALPAESDADALVDARQYISDLITETELCVPLTAGLTDQLVRNRRYQVTGHERGSRRARATRDATPGEDVDASGSSETEDAATRVFGARVGLRVQAPPLSNEALQALAALEISPDDEAEADEPLPAPASQAPPQTGAVSAPADPGPTAATQSPPAKPAQPAPSTAATPTVASSWSKVLPRGDAQHPPQGNPTGNIRLTQAKHKIPWLTWFRQDLFAPASWTTEQDVHGNDIERAMIPFQVTIQGVPLGTMELEATYAPHRESEQRNHTTVLRWGPLLETLQATDYTGSTLTLERLSDNTYRLDIS